MLPGRFANKGDKTHAKQRRQFAEGILWQLGPLHNGSPILCLSEIAAMAFAKELTGLEFCPYALDALLLYGYDPAGACMVRDEIMEHQGEQIQCEQTLKSGKKG